LFAFVETSDGAVVSSARPSRQPTAAQLILVRELRAVAARLEALHHRSDADADADIHDADRDALELLAHAVGLARRLHHDGFTVDDIAVHAGLSATALRRWMDAFERGGPVG
jgi:hypothetical protein